MDMAEITNKDVLIEVQDAEGNKERQFPITKAKNIIGLKKLIEEQVSDISGNSEKYSRALRLLALNPYLIDDTTGSIYRIGVDNGELYHVQVDSGIIEILDEVVEAIEG